MKWIYDEALAREHLQNYKNKTQEENAWIKKENTRVKFLFSLWLMAIPVAVVALVSLLRWLGREYQGSLTVLIVTVFMCAILCFFTAVIWLQGELMDLTDENPRNRWDSLPTDVQYLLATEGKTTLARDLTKDKNGQMMVMHITYEDENHFVSRKPIGCLKRKISTEVSEEVADLTTGVYLIPYVASQEEGENTDDETD